MHVVVSTRACLEMMYLGHHQKILSNESLREEDVASQKWDKVKTIFETSK